MDGTLIDSEATQCGAFLDLLPDLTLTAQELTRRYRGVQIERIVDDLTRNHNVTPGADFIPRFRAHVATLFEASRTAFPGVAEALEQIDLPICVASSAPREKIAIALRLTGLDGLFGDRLYSAYDLRAWKPDPAVFLAAARGMGFAPADCLVIEDSEVGLTAARAAAMRALHFTPDDPRPGSFSHWDQLPDLILA